MSKIELRKFYIWRIRNIDKILKLLKKEYKESGKGYQGSRRGAIDLLMSENRQERNRVILRLGQLGCTKYLNQLPEAERESM